MRLSELTAEVDLAVVDTDVEPAFGIAADPCLVRNGCTVPPIIAHGQQFPVSAFAAFRQLDGLNQLSSGGGARGESASHSAASGQVCRTPWVRSFERFVEIEHVGEIQLRIAGLTHQESGFDQREHDVAQVRRRTDSPMLQHQP